MWAKRLTQTWILSRWKEIIFSAIYAYEINTSGSTIISHVKKNDNVLYLGLNSNRILVSILRNRRNRESTILKSIEDGAKTLFDIVSYTYAEVDRSFWIPAASNVKLHVDHLAEQDKLPKVLRVLLSNIHV